jgi:hypothetical protein
MEEFNREKQEGLWCDLCGKKHTGRCEKTTTPMSKEEKKCKNCGDVSNGQVIHVEKDMRTCTVCGKDVLTYPPLSHKTWEERFDELSTFTKRIGTPKGLIIERYVLIDKDFIRSLISDAERKVLEELMKREEVKRKGHYHPQWNRAKTNTKQEIQAYATSKGIELE